MTYKKFLPEPDAQTKGFWDACRRHELAIQRCADCKAYRHPPLPICPTCQSTRSEWAKVSGRGRLYSYVVVHQTLFPAWTEDVPYNVAQVALEEDERVILTGNVVECGNDDLRVDMALEVVFDDVAEDVTVPRWRPKG